MTGSSLGASVLGALRAGGEDAAVSGAGEAGGADGVLSACLREIVSALLPAMKDHENGRE
jgi:hypothetical protein